MGTPHAVSSVDKNFSLLLDFRNQGPYSQFV